MTRRRFSTLCASLLALLGVLLLAGCFYVPGFGVVKSGTDFRKTVGDENSNKPIRPRVVTREQVIATLGRPAVEQPGGTLIYYLQTSRGYWVYPLCGFAAASDRWYRLELTFGPGGQLAAVDVRNQPRDASVVYSEPRTYNPFESADRTPAATRPASQP